MIFDSCVSVWYKRHFNEARRVGDPIPNYCARLLTALTYCELSTKLRNIYILLPPRIYDFVTCIFSSYFDCSCARTYVKNKTVSFRHEFPQTSATIRALPCSTVDSGILRLLRAAFDIHRNFQLPYSHSKLPPFDFRPCRRRTIFFGYAKHIMFTVAARPH